MFDADMIKQLPQRFREKFVIDPTSGGWHWIRALDKEGYGRYWWNGQTGRAHRFAWEFFYGPIPKGLEIDHVCKVKRCVNPKHMELVTNFENNRRGTAWTFKTNRIRCIRGHVLSGNNLIIERHKNGAISRRCRTCKNQRRKTTKYKEARNARARQRYSEDSEYRERALQACSLYQRAHRKERSEYWRHWKKAHSTS